jgi:hypothetical protein
MIVTKIANDRTRAVGDTARGSKAQTISNAIRVLFRDAFAALASRLVPGKATRPDTLASDNSSNRQNSQAQ